LNESFSDQLASQDTISDEITGQSPPTLSPAPSESSLQLSPQAASTPPPVLPTLNQDEANHHEQFDDILRPDETNSIPRYEYLTDIERQGLQLEQPTLTFRKLSGAPRRETLPTGEIVRKSKHFIYGIGIPDEADEMLNGPEREFWHKAIQEELNSHKQLNTWTVVPSNKSIKTVKCRWVLRKKTEDGDIRYRARLVAKGFTLKRGKDRFY
jgi:hypothetical protein